MAREAWCFRDQPVVAASRESGESRLVNGTREVVCVGWQPVWVSQGSQAQAASISAAAPRGRAEEMKI